MMKDWIDWTESDGQSNSSPTYLALVKEVERLIRADAHTLLSGGAGLTARLIMAQLAHVHHLSPPS